MLCGWAPDQSFRMAPACSCYEQAHSMILRYIRKYHIMHDKRYWTAQEGQYFTVSATKDQIILKMKKKLTKQALLALYLEEVICEIDYLNGPPVINTTVQKDCLRARSFINRYKDTDKRCLGHTVTLFKLGSENATVTHVYRTRYNPSNGVFKFHHKKKLALKEGKKYSLRINTLDLYWPGEFTVK